MQALRPRGGTLRSQRAWGGGEVIYALFIAVSTILPRLPPLMTFGSICPWSCWKTVQVVWTPVPLPVSSSSLQEESQRAGHQLGSGLQVGRVGIPPWGRPFSALFLHCSALVNLVRTPPPLPASVLAIALFLSLLCSAGSRDSAGCRRRLCLG